MKKWIILDKKSGNQDQSTENEIIDILLKNRGINTEKEKEEFLNPKLSDLTLENIHLQRKDLDKAVKRIEKAIQNKESIIVYTDYDVDGVCSGTIMWEALNDLKAKVMPYVPHRIEEGYGLSEKGIDKIHKEEKAKLIITVDHGVTAWEKVEYARRLGIDVIIIDHHSLPSKLPKSSALIHTTSLCATGVAWFFANYLMQKFNPQKSIENKTQNLDLVALATIADLIPLIGINRILVKYGLDEMNKTKRLGLKALVNTSRVKLGEIGVYEVGHMLAPRINAAGRLTHALDSLRLLCTRDKYRAETIADGLSQTNRERQLILEETILHAREQINKHNDGTIPKLIFLANESYNQGVIGLVAGKLVDEFYRPSIVISKGSKYSKASARSIGGFNIVEAIRSCSDLLVDVGGHPMAAGFTVETSKLVLLEKRLLKLAEKELNNSNLERILKIDCEINLENTNDNLYKAIKSFEPFGAGNPSPTFVSNNVKVAKMRLIGKDKNHLKITLQPNNRYNQYIDAIGFGMGSFFEDYVIDQLIDIVYTIDEDKWNLNRKWSNLHSSLQLKLKDVKISAN
ncbi:single-stranded-DNA-specific exonuclease RecJ [Candidatus Gottesmanbacteria bacterium]|nr:single-stranded-DNA-specific exonuclease RecJ [Candidatus Gottesmanbacteria bacterium]